MGISLRKLKRGRFFIIQEKKWWGWKTIVRTLNHRECCEKWGFISKSIKR